MHQTRCRTSRETGNGPDVAVENVDPARKRENDGGSRLVNNAGRSDDVQSRKKDTADRGELYYKRPDVRANHTVASKRLSPAVGDKKASTDPPMPAPGHRDEGMRLLKELRCFVGDFVEDVYHEFDWDGDSKSVIGEKVPTQSRIFMGSCGVCEHQFSEKPSKAEFAEYVLANIALFLQPGFFVGGWRNPKDGVYHLDVSAPFRGKLLAFAVAAANGQEAIYDLFNKRVIDVPDPKTLFEMIAAAQERRRRRDRTEPLATADTTR